MAHEDPTTTPSPIVGAKSPARRTAPGLVASEARKVSVAAGVDPRTVVRVVVGEPVSPMVFDRVAKALRKLGHGSLIPSTPRLATRRKDGATP